MQRDVVHHPSGRACGRAAHTALDRPVDRSDRAFIHAFAGEVQRRFRGGEYRLARREKDAQCRRSYVQSPTNDTDGRRALVASGVTRADRYDVFPLSERDVRAPRNGTAGSVAAALVIAPCHGGHADVVGGAPGEGEDWIGRFRPVSSID